MSAVGQLYLEPCLPEEDRDTALDKLPQDVKEERELDFRFPEMICPSAAHSFQVTAEEKTLCSLRLKCLTLFQKHIH